MYLSLRIASEALYYNGFCGKSFQKIYSGMNL